MTTQSIKWTKKDFSSNQTVRWCAGCGDYAVLSAVQKTMAEFEEPPEKYTFISGIGCSSRFTYYMSSYGFHTIHGRALAVATGAKIANPKQSVWVVTGDGDSLSIGGNHFIHAIRRNIDLVVILLDNRIYGLTKGQYSPTSEAGKVTKSTPFGSLEYPIDPVALALSAGATFVARSPDKDPKLLNKLIKEAKAHKGFSLIHILQNCNIFNDGAFEAFTGRETKEDSSIFLEHGKPMIFGKQKNKGIVLEGLSPKIVEIKDNHPSNILVHDAESKNPLQAHFVNSLQFPDFPYPMGLIRKWNDRSTYETEIENQITNVTSEKGMPNLKQLLHQGDTWEVS